MSTKVHLGLVHNTRQMLKACWGEPECCSKSVAGVVEMVSLSFSNWLKTEMCDHLEQRNVASYIDLFV